MHQYTHADGSVFVAKDQKDGVSIDPELPDDFDNTRNEQRSPAHMRWWGIPYIRTQSVESLDAHYAGQTGAHAEEAREHWATTGRRRWREAWPSPD